MAAGLPAGGHPPGGRGWWIVAALAVTQTVGYGVLYYAFAVLLHPMAAGACRDRRRCLIGAAA